MGRQKSRPTGNQIVSKRWHRLVLGVSRRKPLVEANKEVTRIEKGKREVEIMERECDEMHVGKENWKRIRAESGNSNWMELSERLLSTLIGAPLFKEVRRAP